MQQLVPAVENPSVTFNTTIPALGIAENYLIISELGEDHLYPVFLAASLVPTSIATDSNDQYPFVVIKAIPTTDKYGSFENECNVFQFTAHKNVLGCIQIIKGARLNFRNYNKCEWNLLVLPYLPNGDLLDFLKKSRLDESAARYYFEQVLEAVEHMHSRGFAHRDLKTENFLLNDEFDLVLTDFGHSVQHSDIFGPKIFNDQQSITTPGICPPEFHKGFGYKGTQMDMFALGKLLLIVLTGFNPFKTTKETDANFALIASGNWKKFWSLMQAWMKRKWIKFEEFTPEFKELVEQLLTPDPENRLNIYQIRESAWYRSTKPMPQTEVQSMMIKTKISF